MLTCAEGYRGIVESCQAEPNNQRQKPEHNRHKEHDFGQRELHLFGDKDGRYETRGRGN